jgi:hypothetical protein
MDQFNPTQTVPKSGPKDVFLHLLSIVTLYASVISFIALLWQYINVWYPDPLNYYSAGIMQSIRWSASVLVVMFPVYVWVTWLINRGFGTEPARREIRVRKWLVYLTLFISAITVIVDVITLVYNLFGGELTLKFFLKVLVVLITAAAVFGYYYWDLRSGTSRNLKAFAWGISVLVLAAVVGGFFIVGSPTQQRERNFDARRVENLVNLQNQIVYYYQTKGMVPAKLSDLNDSIGGSVVTNDPETNALYEYTPSGNLSFQLCANFNQPSTSDMQAYPKTAPMPVGSIGGDLYNSNWTHGSGRVCFDRTIDPQRYPRVPTK